MPRRQLSKAVNRRVAVNTVRGETLFVGRLAGFDKDTYVLDQCTTPGDDPKDLAGRQYIDRIHGFITELL